MSTDEAIHVAQTELTIQFQRVDDPEPYDVLRVCEAILNALILLSEELPRPE